MDISIVGGGFCGAACAFHLLRDHAPAGLRLTIVEPRATLGAGLAYSATRPEHRINVAAARMSLLPEDQDHFHRWLEDRGEAARDPAAALPDGRLYPARARYGVYVAEMLAAQACRTGMAFEHVRQTALSVQLEGRGVTIRTDGRTLHADAVVLAISHTAPDLPAPLLGCSGVIGDPWDAAAVAGIAPEARVLVVGTGLTACDVMASLLARGHRGPITAVSRHGLLPRPRTSLPVEAEGDFSTAPETTASALLRRVRTAVAGAAAGGRPWENIVDALRQQAGAAWGTLDWDARRRVLRHLRTLWDVHRFQCAPQIDAALTAAQAAGVLRVRAARLLGTATTPAGIAVALQPRGGGPTETLCVDVVVNCTGPGHRSVVASHPVLRGLAEAGALQPDPAGLGILVDGQSRPIGSDGFARENLFVAGPLARGTFGELMGLPQVNLQPRAVAAALAAQCLA